MDVESLAKNWWAVALRGVAAIVFGVLALVMPGVTLAALVLLFGGYAVLEGVFNIVAAARRREGEPPWWALLLEGLVSVGAGLVTFLWPGLTAVVLVYVIAAWSVLTGVFEIVAAIRLRHQIRDEWWLGLSGALSVAFGALLMIAPGAGALAMVLWIGAYGVVFGALLLGLALRLRTWRRAAVRPPMARAA